MDAVGSLGCSALAVHAYAACRWHKSSQYRSRAWLVGRFQPAKQQDLVPKALQASQACQMYEPYKQQDPHMEEKVALWAAERDRALG